MKFSTRFPHLAEQSVENSVHAFVDVNNCDVYKPASWNKPAKHVRFNLLQDPQDCYNKVTWSGGYLYLR